MAQWQIFTSSPLASTGEQCRSGAQIRALTTLHAYVRHDSEPSGGQCDESHNDAEILKLGCRAVVHVDLATPSDMAMAFCEACRKIRRRWGPSATAGHALLRCRARLMRSDSMPLTVGGESSHRSNSLPQQASTSPYKLSSARRLFCTFIPETIRPVARQRPGFRDSYSALKAAGVEVLG